MEKRSRADLHLHSRASDGVDSAGELVKKADSARLSHVALCDHDTVDAVSAALQAACDSKITVIPAVEIGATLPDCSCQRSRSRRLEADEVHILGYGIDTGEDGLNKVLKELQRSRLDRLDAIVDNLGKLGLQLDTEEILQQADSSHSPGRPHVAAALVEAGYCDDVREAFDLYLASDRKGYVPRERPDCQTAIEAIREAGGLAVVAHPALLATPRESILLLQEMGIRGIEVVHQNHSFEDIRTLIRLCRHLGLIPTGGSDYHGRQRDPQLGDVAAPRIWADKLLQEIST